MAYRAGEYWNDLHRRRAGRLSAVGYSALGEGFNRVTYRRRLRAAERALRTTTSPSMRSRVLEAAAGVGAYSALWQRLGVERWVGLDISTDAVAELRRRFPASEFHTIDLTTTDAQAWRDVRSAGPFGVVTAIDVLYHVVDDAQCASALESLAGLVAPDGVLLVSDVFVQSPRLHAAHVRRRSLEFYQSRLAQLGLRLVHREPVFAVLGDPIPQPGRHPLQQGMRLLWWVLQKSIRSTPELLRSAVGASAATALTPLDALLCKTGAARGVNLELAVFQRSGSPATARDGLTGER